MRLEMKDLPCTRGNTLGTLRKTVMITVNRNIRTELQRTTMKGILQAALDFINTFEAATKPALKDVVAAFDDKIKFEDWARDEYGFELDGRATLANMKKEFVKLYKESK